MELAAIEPVQNSFPVLTLIRPETLEVLSGQIAKSISQPTFSGLQFHVVPGNFSPATPVKRRGKSMSRRTGQTGHIEKSGKWWVVRWWMDVAGQEKRALKRARICPIAGPGVLSASARKRRAREIIAESGADSVEYFSEVVEQQKKLGVVTFKNSLKPGSNVYETGNVNL